MYVVAVHTISDPERFWDAAEGGMDQIPEGIALHSVFPSRDGTSAICLWEADSQAAVTDLVEEMVGDFSSNQYFEVNAQNATGLPTRASA